MWMKLKTWLWPLAIGIAGWLAVVVTRTGPGITSDEPFNVFYGKAFVQQFCETGREFFTHDSLGKTFATRHEHPPLGRWFIGWVWWLQQRGPARPDSDEAEGLYEKFKSWLQSWFEHRNAAKPDTVDDIYAGRVAPATAFAIMLMLITRVVGTRHGTVSGVVAGVSLALMPRVFAHAHIAALDTFVSCTYLLAVLSAGWMMARPRPWLHAPLAGILLGAALLTKMHGVFLLPVVGLWAISYYGFFRARSLVPLFLWCLSGVEIFVLGWPWLWQDVADLWTAIVDRTLTMDRLPHVIDRLTAYLSSSVDRPTIYVQYFDHVYADRAMPWHYPWVMFATTVPLGLHVLGVVGLVKQLRQLRTEPRGALFVIALVVPLVVFSIPGVPVYDGVRLFLMVFPFWAMFVGRGAGVVYDRLASWFRASRAASLLAAFLACQAWGVVHFHPFQLSYYNLLVAGLRGADRLGLEITYWGDAVTPGLVNRWSEIAPKRSCAVLVPTLYTAQQELYETELTEKREQELHGSLASGCPYVIVYNRRAYLDDVADLLDSPYCVPIAENTIDGVWLSRVYVRRRAEITSPPSARQMIHE
jgi:4-amino-4-deoxy-L-arabinose transferase-like glycosyltransferase